jgi:hypothetical protein
MYSHRPLTNSELDAFLPVASRRPAAFEGTGNDIWAKSAAPTSRKAKRNHLHWFSIAFPRVADWLARTTFVDYTYFRLLASRTLEIAFQERANPAPCQRTTVSGDHKENLFPSGPEPARPNPEHLIAYRESWPGAPSLQRYSLLAKSQILNKQGLPHMEQPQNRA